MARNGRDHAAEGKAGSEKGGGATASVTLTNTLTNTSVRQDSPKKKGGKKMGFC